MSKEELVYITLKQLMESFKTTPENFRLEDPATSFASSSLPGPTIIWQFKVELERDKFIQDPLNSIKTIIVSFNINTRSLNCYIFDREVNNLNNVATADTHVYIQYQYVSNIWYRTYRLFSHLKKSITKYKNDKEFLDYMKKLSRIFPATHEDEIFK